MSRHLLCIALAVAVPLFAPLAAQQPPAKPKTGVTKPDSSNKTMAAEADTTKEEGDDEAESTLTTGISFGGLNYVGGRSERATSATLHWRALSWLSLGLTPTFARAVEPGLTVNQTSTNSGLTDLPLDISADHTFDLPLSPSLGLGLGIMLPVGDTTGGFGAGSLGSSISLSLGIAPTDRIGLTFGVAKSLTDFSAQSAFNGSSSESGDVGVSIRATDRLSFNAGFGGELGSVDTTYGRSSSFNAGVSVGIPIVSAVAFSASRGLSGASPSWSFAIGVGTDFAALGNVTLGTVASRLRQAFGGGTHGLPKKGSKVPAKGRKKKSG